MAKTIIAYDLGTGGAKASLYDVDGACRASTFVSYETNYPGRAGTSSGPRTGGTPSSHARAPC